MLSSPERRGSGSRVGIDEESTKRNKTSNKNVLSVLIHQAVCAVNGFILVGRVPWYTANPERKVDMKENAVI